MKASAVLVSTLLLGGSAAVFFPLGAGDAPSVGQSSAAAADSTGSRGLQPAARTPAPPAAPQRDAPVAVGRVMQDRGTLDLPPRSATMSPPPQDNASASERMALEQHVQAIAVAEQALETGIPSVAAADPVTGEEAVLLEQHRQALLAQQEAASSWAEGAAR